MHLPARSRAATATGTLILLVVIGVLVGIALYGIAALHDTSALQRTPERPAPASTGPVR